MRPRKAAVGFVLVTLALDSIGIGMVVPIVPELVRMLGGTDRAGASLAVGPLVATFAIAQLFAAPVLGALSDHFGRRPVLLGSVGGLALNYLLLVWAPSLPWLFLGRVIAGATSANFSSAAAYIADITPPAERAKRFGLVGAAFSLGFVIGPALGGQLGAISLRLPFEVAAALSACNWLYGLLVLPESLPRERRAPLVWRSANPWGAARMLWADPVLRRLSGGWAALWFGLNTLQAVFVLSTGQRFGWGPSENGLALGLLGVSSALVQSLLIRRVVARVGERMATVLGFLSSAAAYAIIGLATSGWMIFLAVIVQSLGGLANPALRALVSGHVGPDRQGRVLGSLSAVEGTVSIVGPLIASFLFRAFSGRGAILDFPGAPFLAAAAVYVLATASVRRVPAPSR